MRKNGLFANLKKCWFYKHKMQFLGYVVLNQGIQSKDERIETVRNWLEPKLVQDIWVFINFINFYQCFIQGFSKMAATFTSMLKITGLSHLILRELGIDEVVGGSGKANNMNLSKKSKNAKSGI